MNTFNVAPREGSGAKPKQLRRNGTIPMALIERHHGTKLLQAPEAELRLAVRHLDAHGALSFHIEGETGTRKALIRQIELDALRREILHVTLQEVADEDELRAEIPLIVIGTPRNDQGDGTLSQTVTHLKVKARHGDLPDHIEVNIEGLELGRHIEIGQLGLPDSWILLTPAETAVVTYVRTPGSVSEGADETEVPV